MYKLLVLIFLSLISITGCVSPGALCGDECVGPTESNGWTGRFLLASTNQTEIESFAQNLCRPYGGLKSFPAVIFKTPTYDRYSFQCNGFAAKNFSPALEVAKPIAPTQAKKDTFDLDAAKTKCDDLGFKQGTEGFGKCVLQLTK